MIKRLTKAVEIAKHGLLYIDPVLIDDEQLQLLVKSQNSTEKHMVSCVDNIWRCSCDDFHHNGLHNQSGGFDCKHVLAVKYLLTYRLEIYGDLESLKVKC